MRRSILDVALELYCVATLAVLGACLAGCGQSSRSPEAPTYEGSVEPGGSASLAPLVATASGGAAVTWSVAAGGGSITQQGVYTAPSCAQVLAALGAADVAKVGRISSTDTVHAAWAGGSLDVQVVVEEAVVGPITVSPTDATVEPGGEVQFSASLPFTCHTYVTP